MKIMVSIAKTKRRAWARADDDVTFSADRLSTEKVTSSSASK